MSIRIDGTNTTANPGTTGADADTGLVYGSNEVKIVTGGTDRVKVDSSGRLLVGTTNAVAFGSRQVLVVANGTTGGVISLYNSTTATANTRISSNPTGSEINDIGIHAASTNGSIIAYTNNDTERLRIDSSGKVYFGNFGDVANAGYIDKATTGDKELNIVASRSTAQNRNIVFKGRSNTEAMRIDSAGRVGIGTTTPTFTAGSGLHIAGSSGALKLQNTNNGDWAYVEYADESNTTKFIQGYRDQSGVYGIRPGASLSSTSGISLDSSGNVGIGTASPTTSVDVNDSQAFLQLKSTGGTNAAGIQLVPGGQSQAFYIYNNGSRNLIFEDHATERMRILSSGGLTFNGDTAQANALDDYEEGTFDVTLAPGTSGSITLNSSFNTLSYTKVGRLVTISGQIRISSVSSPVGTLLLTTLPFAARSTTELGRAGGSVLYYDASAGNGNYYKSPACDVLENANTLRIYAHQTAGGITIAGNDEIGISFTYVA